MTRTPSLLLLALLWRILRREQAATTTVTAAVGTGVGPAGPVPA